MVTLCLQGDSLGHREECAIQSELCQGLVVTFFSVPSPEAGLVVSNFHS